MELAKLLVEAAKALAWPLVVLFLALSFRTSIERILRQLSERLASAETLKLGVLGQEVQISGTAKELLKERQQLAEKEGPDAKQEVERIDRSAELLNTPVADMVGLALLNARKGLSPAALVSAVLSKLEPGKKPSQFPPMTVILMSGTVEKVVSELISLGLASTEESRHLLTQAGIDFFDRVATKQRDLLKSFAHL